MAANPVNTDPLDLDAEVKVIDQELIGAGTRDKFAFEVKRGVRASEISRHFLKVEPHIVHFSGHGSRAHRIYLLRENQKSQPVGVRVLMKLFEAFEDNIRCVVLNACYTDVQAIAISRYIDCVIGMSKPIGDEAAIEFARGFYRGIGWRRDVKRAFLLGQFQVGTRFPLQHTTPEIMWKNNKPQRIVFG